METVPVKTVTIRDVAQKAGVGLGTVSRVLNGSPLVSQATRERVLKVIAELRYVPNRAARHLSSGKTMTIAVVVPFFTRPSQLERLRGVEHTLAESDYDLIVYNVETVERRDVCVQTVPRRERADGVLIVSLSPRDDDLPFLRQAGVPIVLVDANHPSLEGLNRVIVDDIAGGKMATQHLIQLGHRRIAYLSDPLDNPFNFTSSRDRLIGYKQALEEAHIPFNPAYHKAGEHGRYEARRLAGQLLAMEDRPTAIFAASDTQAVGVLEAARDADLQVPQDLSVVGYDDIELAEYLGLTTIRQLLFESGQQGVQLLLNALANPQQEARLVRMPPELVVRSTSAAPGRHAGD